MPALYQFADIFPHLSKEESFGNVFIEAMACGLPIVAHDSSRLRWIVGEDEFLVDPGDPAAVAQHIELARQAPAAQRQARVAKAAAFAWPKIGKMYREFLGEVCRTGPIEIESLREPRRQIPQRQILPGPTCSLCDSEQSARRSSKKFQYEKIQLIQEIWVLTKGAAPVEWQSAREEAAYSSHSSQPILLGPLVFACSAPVILICGRSAAGRLMNDVANEPDGKSDRNHDNMGSRPA
jgi:hypothetical protein